MKKISETIIDFMVENRIIFDRDKEIYLFGFEFMLRVLVNLLTLVFIGFLFGMIGESIVFVIFSMFIRSYAGGFHADNPIVCYFISVVTIILMLFCIQLQIWNLYLCITLIVISIGIILRYSPVEHQNKPLEEIERKTYYKRLLRVVCLLILIMFAFVLLGKMTYLFASSFAFVVSSSLVYKQSC